MSGISGCVQKKFTLRITSMDDSGPDLSFVDSNGNASGRPISLPIPCFFRVENTGNIVISTIGGSTKLPQDQHLHFDFAGLRNSIVASSVTFVIVPDDPVYDPIIEELNTPRRITPTSFIRTFQEYKWSRRIPYLGFRLFASSNWGMPDHSKSQLIERSTHIDLPLAFLVFG